MDMTKSANDRPSPAQRKHLTNAANHPRGLVCGRGHTMDAMVARGWVINEMGFRITDAGRAAIGWTA